MTTPDLHLVCLLDVLGFESLLRRLGPAGLHQKLSAVSIRISAAISQNELYHLIQIVALACLCRGARLSTASEIASFAEVAVPPGSLAAPAARGGPPL